MVTITEIAARKIEEGGSPVHAVLPPQRVGDGKRDRELLGVDRELPVKVRDIQGQSVNRIFERNLDVPDEVVAHAHEDGVVVHLDVKVQVARLLVRVPWLLPKAMSRDDRSVPSSFWNSQFEI